MSESESVSTKQEQIDRITAMEAVLQTGRQAVSEAEAGFERLKEVAARLVTLNEYYGSPLWWQDFEDDEAGKLPSDLPRGILSEDEAFNLLEDYRGLLARMREFADKVLPREE